MILKKPLFWAFVLAITVVAGLASFSRHGVWEREIGTQLLWSKEEAYFFAARQREGWSGTYLELAWETIRHYVGLAGRRTDRKPWLEVTRITAQGTKQVVIPDTSARPMGVFENHIYLSDNAKLVKWVDDKLTPVGSDEEARFLREMEGSGEYKDVNGWSREINIARGSPGENNYALVLGGVSVNVLTTQDPKRSVVSVTFVDGRVTTMLDVRHDYVLMDEASYRSAFSSTLLNYNGSRLRLGLRVETRSPRRTKGNDTIRRPWNKSYALHRL